MFFLCTTNLISLLLIPKQFTTHCASRAMSSTSWLQSLSQFWTGSWVGSLTSHNDIAELLLQSYICTQLSSNDHVPLCYVPHILYVPLDSQLKAVLFLPITFLTASMSGWLHFTSPYSCSIGQQYVNSLKTFHICCSSHCFPLPLKLILLLLLQLFFLAKLSSKF